MVARVVTSMVMVVMIIVVAHKDDGCSDDDDIDGNGSVKDSYTSLGNPVKEILLKLNLPDHRSILTDSKDTYKDRCMSVQKSQDHKMTKSQDGEMRLCLVDDLTVLNITSPLTSKDKGTSSNLKPKITTTYSQEKIKYTSLSLRDIA
ncbi:hypothetical protein Tco_0098939 [Tanacetum coccineum]